MPKRSLNSNNPIKRSRAEKIETYSCMYPTFDEYLFYLLKIDRIHNLLQPKKKFHNLPDALSCAENYCQFMNMQKHLDYVYEAMTIKRKNRPRYNFSGYKKHIDGEAILPLYNIRSGEFNKGHNPKIMGELDKIFETAPPLTQALTVYRKYECPPNLDDVSTNSIFMSNRFLSTSLSLSYLPSVTFWDDCPKDIPIYCRIDVMPGVKVIPLLNRVNMAAARDGNSIFEQTEFEILLPRNAVLYRLSKTYSYENSPAITIVHKNEDEIADNKPHIPIISHHFILANESEFNVEYPKHTAHPDIQPHIINIKLTESQLDAIKRRKHEIIQEQERIEIEEKLAALDAEKKAEITREVITRREFSQHDKQPKPVWNWEIVPDQKYEVDSDGEEWEVGGKGKKTKRKKSKRSKRKTRR